MQISQKDIRGVPSVSAINSCWHSYQPQAWPGRSSNMVFSCLFMSFPFSDRARNEWRVAFVGRKEHAFCMSKLNLRKETLTFGCADTSSRIPLTFFVFGEFGIPANANKQAHWRHGVLPSSREVDVVHPLHVKQQTGGWTAHHSFICSHLDCEKPKFVAQSFNCSSILHTTLSKLKSASERRYISPKLPYCHLQQVSTEGLSNRKSVPRISFGCGIHSCSSTFSNPHACPGSWLRIPCNTQ